MCRRNGPTRNRPGHPVAVAAKLQVHEQGKAPLLCVTGTYKVASGNLSLPGVITRKSK